MKRIFNSRGGVWPPLIFLALLLGGSYIFSTTLVTKSATDTTEFYTIDPVGSSQKEGALQMKSLNASLAYPTIPQSHRPPPEAIPTGVIENACNHDNGKKMQPGCKCYVWIVTCQNKGCVNVKFDDDGHEYKCDEVFHDWCRTPQMAGEGDGDYCIGKPVIYLYPKEPIVVNVTIEAAGEIFISDPQISFDRTKNKGSWLDVMAHPNGILFYKGHPYRELFYESNTPTLNRPKKGIVMSKDSLETQLLDFIKRLGLTRNDEQKEFMDWWMPQLLDLQTEKIFVSILEKNEKDRLDKVTIHPKPDTFIEFIVYFAPLKENETVEPLILPPTPERVGFTAIEWGGVIEPDPQF